MSQAPIDPKRRRVIITGISAIAAAPFIKPLLAGAAEGDLPHLAEDDPTATALSYHNDASQAPRTDKPGVPASEQFCHNCRFIQADSGEWRPCQIFPGKAVNENGWCLSWVAKA